MAIGALFVSKSYPWIAASYDGLGQVSELTAAPTDDPSRSSAKADRTTARVDLELGIRGQQVCEHALDGP